MALFDKNASEIVARIVYAGPPLAGKTETVRVLAKMLLGDRAESAMYSPSEAQGRTLYFDWVSYVGGSFRGNKVRCQIISVPGQDALSERRRHILQEADAVVFVIDSTPDGLRQGRYYFEEIQSWISRSEDEPPIALVVQANKRDLPDALPASEIKQSLGSDRMLTVFETTATAGTGIREAFVMCVSQALARIGKLLDSGRLAIGKPEINSGDDLLTQIEAREKLDQAPAETAPAQSALAAIATTRESSATSLLTRALSSINIAQSSRTAVSSEIPNEPVAVNAHAPTATLTSPPPLLPDGNLHAGTIWPPVAGRLALHEIAGHAGIPERQTDGIWLYSAGPWRLRSRPENVFETAGEALRMLLVNAYRHKEMERIISPNRCLALTSADGKSRRLWEICRTEKTLGDALTSTLHGTQSILVLASETVEIASFLVQAAHIFKNQKIPLPPHLSHIGKIADQPVYLGFLPAAETDQQADSKIDVSQLIRSQFYRPVKQALSEKNIKIPLLLRAMQQLKNHGDAEPAIVDTLSALFIGE